MKLSKLIDRYKGQKKSIYIIGTGPSLRMFPQKFFSDKLCIGLNQAFKTIWCKYNLTIHTDLIPQDFYSNPETKGQHWITKRKGWLKKRIGGDIEHNVFWFHNNKDVKDYSYLTNPQDDQLYVGRGIHTAALALAARMAVQCVYLVGCDMAAPTREGDYTEHHATPQHVNFHGLPAHQVYREYYLNATQVRYHLTQKYPKFKIFSLSPYLAAEYWKEDYLRLCTERDLPSFPVQKEIVDYPRDHLDFE